MALLLPSALAADCSDPDPVSPPVVSAVEDMVLEAFTPGVLVPGSRLVVRGANFVPSFAGATSLHLEGSVDGTSTSLVLTAQFVDYDRLEVSWTLPLTGSIAPPVIASVSSEAASLGQYVDVTGRGFVGPRDGDPLAVTTIEVTGTFTPDGFPSTPT